MTEYYLWLLQLMGVANPKSHQLIQHYGSVKAVYEAICERGKHDFLTEHEKKSLENATLENSAQLMRYCEKRGIGIVTMEDGDYPERLKNIYNPPILLFYRGNIKGLDDEVCITGVGARGVSEYTAKVARRTCTDLAKLGAVLISGMAAGVDHIVHQSAVEAKARTIGVLACGISVDYPKGSMAIRERIYENGGACVSELMPEAPVKRTYFQARNRILSGLSMGVIVFQAGIGSGSLITAAHAVQQGRDLFCVPPRDVFDRDYAGVIEYLRDGAIPLFNYLDVVNSMYAEFSSKASLPDSSKYTVNPANHFIFTKTQPQENSVKPTENAGASKKPKPQKSEDPSLSLRIDNKPAEKDYSGLDLSENHMKIIDFLKEKGGEQTLEAITTGCGIEPSDVSEYLLDLELAGVIADCVGAKYRLI